MNKVFGGLELRLTGVMRLQRLTPKGVTVELPDWINNFSNATGVAHQGFITPESVAVELPDWIKAFNLQCIYYIQLTSLWKTIC